MAQRGRPKSVNTEETPRVFTREYRDEYGAQTWYFDLDKNPYGPIRVDNMDVIQAREELGERPLSKQKFRNPANGKLVGYQRAKQLNII